jgi:alpha-beta hydrolase superfamily lysophospholipase
MSQLRHRRFDMTSTDGLQVCCNCWTNRKSARGVVQIAHGMGEHIGRYHDLIDLLVHAGMVVYGNDHRGHGHSAPSSSCLGDFGAGGFDLLVRDMVQLTRLARAENPDFPFILFGHGMGSFAAQKYILDHSELLDGLVLSGSGTLDKLAKIAKATGMGEDFLNAPFAPTRTPFDWLSRDSAEVSAFIKDPLCFGALKPESMDSFLAVGSELADPKCLRGIRSDLPIYLFSGSEDPVGQRLEGVRDLMDRYHRAGLSNISHHFYPGARHEMLNETNRDEVRRNLLLWISELLQW